MVKKLLFLLLILCCNEAYSKDNVKLHGKIANPTKDSITAYYYPTSIVDLLPEYSARINKDGTFSLAFDVPDGFTSINVTYGDDETKIFVQPGVDLTLTFDAKHFDSTIHYDGSGKELANFMAKYKLEKRTPLEITGKELFKEEPAVFEAGLRKLEDEELDFLQKNGRHLPTGFADYFKADTRYKVYGLMEMYPAYHEMSKGGNQNMQNIPKENFVLIKNIPATFDDAFIDLPSYVSYATNYLPVLIHSHMVNFDLPKESWPSIDSIQALAYNMMPPKTAEYYIANSIHSGLRRTPVKKTEQRYERYKKLFPDSKNLQTLEQEILYTKTFADGMPAIDFDITTPDGKKMKLSDLKGNVVFIDFWWRGCVPCLAEMPASKKVCAYFKGKPVSFVYVSIDEDDDLWQKAIKKYEIDGINTRVKAGWQSETLKKYKVSGVPNYFLVDKLGNFASSNDLARPSDTEKLIAQIEKLLK